MQRAPSRKGTSQTSKASLVILIVLVVGVLVVIENLNHAMGIIHIQNNKELIFQDSFVTGQSIEDSDKVQQRIRDKYHVVVSVSDSPYQQWQCLIFYYHYQKIKRENPDSPMGGFTRLLHSGQSDEFAEYINTIVVDPLPKGVDKGFKPLHRPWAFVQMMQKVDFLEDYIFMAEPDQILLKPPGLWATPDKPAAYPFTYMTPKQFESVLTKYNEREVPNFVDTLYQIGNSPMIIYKQQLKTIAPIWHDFALRLKKDDEAEKSFGWILEMYAFVLAASQYPDGPLEFQYHYEFQLQPPWDTNLQQVSCYPAQITCPRVPATMIHYTYGQDMDENGKFTPGKVGTYHWDKRDYSTRFPRQSTHRCVIRSLNP
eukprot:TRINITY_DN4851_c0_g1_i2.p1 TRINITY_DN4851_c0_g1~~TRINITY_DN4851_c0_g1_i2.p1  ORF type:complete len:370 (-),score=13.63 TRINITY_DN4851_c0_g1_i2:54-1163(-)